MLRLCRQWRSVAGGGEDAVGFWPNTKSGGTDGGGGGGGGGQWYLAEKREGEEPYMSGFPPYLPMRSLT